jgi:hypothetical protein
MAAAATATGYPLLGLMWTMLILFGLVLWFWLLYVMLGDLFGRPDLGRWAKAGWTAVLILLPLLGVLAYLVARGTGMGERWTV